MDVAYQVIGALPHAIFAAALLPQGDSEVALRRRPRFPRESMTMAAPAPLAAAGQQRVNASCIGLAGPGR